MRPLRIPVVRAVQRGLLPARVRAFAPWQWSLSPFTVRGPGCRFRWFPTPFDPVGHEIFWTGLKCWECETTPVMTEYFRTSRLFLDIGANTGIYTVLACAVNPSIRVVAFEPVPRIYAAFQRNVAENGFAARVTALNIALADSNAVVPFHEAEDTTMNSLAVSGYRGQPGQLIEVGCRTLDSVRQELNLQPDFIKIDVEGFEDAVLQGAVRLLTDLHPPIVLEANPGDPADRVAELLSRHGYQFHNLTAAGPERRDWIRPVESQKNWLCTPPRAAANRCQSI